MMSVSLFCTVEFDGTKTSQPQSIIASAFRNAMVEADLQYQSLSVEKEDMLNEYTETVPTRATVTLTAEAIDVDAVADFRPWIERQMNHQVGDSVYGVTITALS
ncbi:hypothetical protein [Halorientalis sp.]|uniref:hypothetical protein n=1 Tax=Halorientalis sp. TaxID=1931229 RepID=UPI0026268C63|nr:hypothetical protein [Halorientalis sp.]